MAPAKSQRQSRKRRRPGQPAPAPRGVPTRPASPVSSRRDDRLRQSSLGSYGERPPSPFGGLPVSEMAILVGAVGACVGVFGNDHSALIVGVVVCALGVLEFTAREHFSGYRSHAMLLAAVPPVAILIVSVTVLGAPAQRTTRELLLLAVVPVFALAFWGLRKRFRTARQSRIVRRAAP